VTVVNATGEIVIARPRDEVFAWLCDPVRIPRWRADVVDASALEGRGVGARYRETIKFLGRKSQTFEIVEHAVGERLTVRAIDGLSLRPVQRFELVAEGDVTRLRYAIELPVRGWFRLMSPMLRRMIPRKWRGYAAALKRALEA
jgi:uncharacterized protein YndB with AHSA1/START domain